MRALPLPVLIALRNVRRNSRRSLLTVLAIAFGLFCLIVFQALKAGLHREMIVSTVGLDAGSLQIHAPGYEANLAVLSPLGAPETVEAALEEAGITRHARRLKTPALVLAGPKSSSVLLSGIEPEREPEVTFIASRMIEGTYPAEGRGVLISHGLARTLGIGIGDELTLMGQSAFGRPVVRKMSVGGIYRTDLSSFDQTHIFLCLADLQLLLETGDAITEIAASLPVGSELDATRWLRERFGDRYQVSSWQEIAPDVVQLIDLNDATMRLLIGIVFAIVALGIVNTMTMVVFERFRELGVLAAIGTTPGGLIGMIVLEASFLGLFASVLGTLAGGLACAWLARHGLDLTRFTSHNQYFATSHVLRAHLMTRDLIAANLITVATALLAGLYPAWKASRLSPARAIRHT
jgi:ABC-type lipoprotein release transport system permease subunit